MNKADLIEIVSQNGSVPVARAHRLVDIMLSAVQDALLRGERVTISDFGTFTLSTRKAFSGRNPRNGATVAVPSIRVPVFKAGKGLKADLNK